MGLMCSWVAVKGASKAALLAAVDLAETDVPREALPGCRDVNFCYRELPGGWTVLASDDFEWASRGRVVELSRLGPTVGCQYADTMMTVATGAEKGVELWRVLHDCENEGVYHLDVSGDAPTQFAGIRDEYFRLQNEDGGKKSSVNFIHEIPLQLSQVLCGYRPDEGELEPFLALKPVGAEDEAADYGRRSRKPREASEPFFGSFFGLFKRK